jgi:hypothetical protein
MITYLRLLFSRRPVQATFNPEMCYRHRHCTMWIYEPGVTELMPVGVHLNKPMALKYFPRTTMKEIIRQAKLVQYTPVYIVDDDESYTWRERTTPLPAAKQASYDKHLTGYRSL